VTNKNNININLSHPKWSPRANTISFSYDELNKL
jgi:hypothetical protein